MITSTFKFNAYHFHHYPYILVPTLQHFIFTCEERIWKIIEFLLPFLKKTNVGDLGSAGCAYV